MAQNAQASINIPQLLAVALVGFLAIRWYLSKPSTGGGNSRRSTSQHAQQVDITKIDQIANMFPQLSRRDIAWDLHRNGGSVAATTERVLRGRSLDAPPPTFQPELPTAAATTAASSSNPNSGRTSGAGQESNLITRYGLQTRVGGKGKEPIQSQDQQRNAWSSDKAARAENLKKRREEMILEARRKMQEAQINSGI